MERQVEIFLKTTPFYEYLLDPNVFVVGGAIRAFVMGEEPLDIDVVFFGNAFEFARNVANRMNATFIQLDEGTFRIVKNDAILDVSYPKGDNIYEDLKLRDFTINAIAYNVHLKQLMDPLKGLHDLEGRILRATSEEAFENDPLRLLRAFRFQAQYGLDIEALTYEWIRKHAKLIGTTASERIHYELMKIFSAFHTYPALEGMYKSGLLFQIFPELEELEKPFEGVEQNIMVHTLTVMKFLDFYLNNMDMSPFHYFKERFSILEDEHNRALLKIGALFHDVGKPKTYKYENGEVHFYGHDVVGAKMFRRIGRRLSFSNKEIKIISLIIENHMHPHFLSAPEVTIKAINRFLNRLGEWAFPVVLLAFCDALSTKLSAYGVAGHLKLAKLMHDVLKRKEAEANKPPRLITGYDLIELGLKPSPVFKHILQEIDDLQAEGKIRTREEALQILPQIVEKYVKDAKNP